MTPSWRNKRWGKLALIVAVLLSLYQFIIFNQSQKYLVRHRPLGHRPYLRVRDLTPQIVEPGPFHVNYTFDDPSNYSGPVVKGWPPGKSRHVPDYIRPDEDTIITDLSCLDLNSTKVLIIIQSDPTLVDRRNSNRYTWMTFQESYPFVKTIFLFGTQDTSDLSVPFMPLEPERNQFCDIVQMDYVDHYENVTLDTVSALKFVSQFNWPGGERPDFIVIADDDAYVNIPMLWALLYEEKKIEKTSKIILGHAFFNQVVMVPSEEDYTNKLEFVGRLISPSYMYKWDHYPDSISGSCFILPIFTLDCLYMASLALPLFHINDIHVGAFAAESCGFDRVDDARFHPGRVEMKNLKYQDVSFHWSNAKRKEIFHHIYTQQNGDISLKLSGRYFLEPTDGKLKFCKTDNDCVDGDDS